MATIEEALALAVKHHQAGDLRYAEEICRRVLEADPDNADACCCLAAVFASLERFNEAVAGYRRALRCQPDHDQARAGLQHALIESRRQGVRFLPNHPRAHYDLGAALVNHGRMREAVPCFEQSIRLQPDDVDAHYALARVLLMYGDFRRGWREFEWRLADTTLGLKRRFDQPRWDGSDLDGRAILLYTEGGFGDALHFVRYVPLVAQRRGRVILECQPELAPLLRGVRGRPQVVVRGEALPRFDVQAPLQSLPLAFDTMPETVPADVPYLYAEPARVKAWRARLRIDPSTLTIGLVWSGSFKDLTRNDPNCGLASFAPVAGHPGVTFYSLQKGPATDQLCEPPAGLRVIDLGPELTDFAETAAVVSLMDLVISVDTSMVHLAGALGRPVWAVLAVLHDFRWLSDREDSPWYPSIRLFRSSRADYWDDVFEQIARELRALPPRK